MAPKSANLGETVECISRARIKEKTNFNSIVEGTNCRSLDWTQKKSHMKDKTDFETGKSGQ